MNHMNTTPSSAHTAQVPQAPLPPGATPVEKTQEEEAYDARDKAFDNLMVQAQALIYLGLAEEFNPAIDGNEMIMDIQGELEERIVQLSYELVRADRRHEQTEANPTFPFDSLDDGYYCQVCGNVDEMTIESVGDWRPSQENPPSGA